MTTEWWTSLRRRVDVRSVHAMEDIFGENGDRSRIQYLRDLDALDQASCESALAELPSAVQTLVRDTQLPPFLANMPGLAEAQERACRHFGENSFPFIVALMCKSLPECYAGARGAKVLARTGVLGGPQRKHSGADDTMVRRVMETSVFVQNVMNWDLWSAPHQPAIRTIQKIRLFHAGIRVMIERHGQRDGQPWDYEGDGDPINMQDTVATLLAFSLQSIRGARKLGYRISEQTERDILLHWIVIGHHLGLDEDVLREAHKDPYGMWNRVCQSEFAWSESGDMLTTALRTFLRDHVFILQRRRYVPLMLMKRLMDPRAIRALRLDHNAADGGALYRVLFAIAHGLHGVLIVVPIVGPWLTRWLGKELMTFTTHEWAGDNPERITLENELRSV